VTHVNGSVDPCDHIALAMSLAKKALIRFDDNASVMDHDVFGEAMLGLVIASQDFDADKQSFATWAQYKIRGRIGIYKEKELRYRKKRVHFRSYVDDSEDSSGVIESELLCIAESSDDERMEVLDAIKDVSGREAEIIRDRLSGLTLQQIGDKYGISRQRVQKLEERGIEMIRKQLLKNRGESCL
jgi:RNA polymerase sigma factor (sigma-70 family)